MIALSSANHGLDDRHAVSLLGLFSGPSPPGRPHTDPNSLDWTSRYGSVVNHAYEINGFKGMNSKSLTASLLYLTGSDYGQDVSFEFLLSPNSHIVMLPRLFSSQILPPYPNRLGVFPKKKSKIFVSFWKSIFKHLNRYRLQQVFRGALAIIFSLDNYKYFLI